MNMIIFVLSIVIIGVSADKSLVATLRSQENFKNKSIYFNYESQKNGSLFYLLCDRTSPDNVPCTVFKEEHFVDHLPRLSMCNVTLHSKDPTQDISEKIRVIPINRIKILILWAINGEDRYPDIGRDYVLKFTIVDFETCRTTETYVDVISYLPYKAGTEVVRSTSVVFYDNHFDVAYRYQTREYNPYYRVRININTGKIVRERELWFTNLYNMDTIPKDTHDPEKGHFFFDTFDGYIYTWKNYSLFPFPTSNYYEDWKKFRYSVRDHLITICTETNYTEVKCDQIDYNGTVMMHAVFNLTKVRQDPASYTLYGGGFLLLTVEHDLPNPAKDAYRVTKVDTSGKWGKSIHVEDFNCDMNLLSGVCEQFFENEQGNPCIALLCHEWEKLTPLPEDLYIQCFNQTIF